MLRVVSTDTPAWWSENGGDSESYLTTLRQSNGALTQVGRIGGLGKGERVYAVRFVGNTGYVVTFRQIDPLYTVDLTDPEQPRVLGELKISGYSAYLHPIGDDLLLGIGQEADDAGHPLGTQISIFDVSDLKNPKLLSRAPLGQGWSEAESDHHAFLFWPKTGLVVVPFVEKAAAFSVEPGEGRRRSRPHRQRRRRAVVDAADPPFARRRRQRADGVRRGRALERSRLAGRAGLGRVPGSGASGRAEIAELERRLERSPGRPAQEEAVGAATAGEAVERRRAGEGAAPPRPAVGKRMSVADRDRVADAARPPLPGRPELHRAPVEFAAGRRGRGVEAAANVAAHERP